MTTQEHGNTDLMTLESGNRPDEGWEAKMHRRHAEHPPLRSETLAGMIMGLGLPQGHRR